MAQYTLRRTGEPILRISGEIIAVQETASHLLTAYALDDGGYAGSIQWKRGQDNWHWSKMFRRPDSAADWFADHQPLDYAFGTDAKRRQIADNYRIRAQWIRDSIWESARGRRVTATHMEDE